MTLRQAFRSIPVLLALALLLAARSVRSHELDSATLSLTEVAEGRFVVRWHASSATLLEEHAQPAVFPKRCRLQAAELDCGAAGLVGAIDLPWLKGSETRVMVQVVWHSGKGMLRVLGGNASSMMVYGEPASGSFRQLGPIAMDYTRLGVEHILTGYDHLLFVLVLTFLVGSQKKQLVATITAFTIAHSLTLALTVLGWLSLPVAPVETMIALSIVLACAECLRPADSLAHRAPWIVAFAFGLLHGFGFASSLVEAGLPEQHVPAALFFFNVGVETGQFSAIALIGAIQWLGSRIVTRHVLPARGFIYVMGGLAAFWSIERACAIFVG